ncbi:hypothetical protein ACFSTH_08375 [Paenibacillus yanchengensis]|uniref:Phage tail tape measure protein n=1 Tax=Paenibacillus yanchengensis TaxID=2035833 RepID=A0ABW4YKY3_9BACL
MTVEIGELRARLTAESRQMRQEVQAVKKDFIDLGEQGKKSASDLKTVETAIALVGASKDKLAILTATLDNVNARIEQQRKKLAELKASYDNTFNESAKSKLQDQILNTESSLLRLIQTSDSTAQKIWDLEDSINQAGVVSQQAASEFNTLDNALKEIGLNGEQINVVKRHLDNLDPTKADRQLEKLSVTLKKLGVDSQSIDKINQELRQTEQESNRAKQGISGIASGLASLGASAVLSKLIDGVKTLAGEAHQLASSYQGLNVVAKSFNVDTEKAADLADTLADRWGLSKTVMADTVKTYLSLNLSLEEAEEIITATADAAVYNREAHLSWEEAIKQVSQGIKSGNSNLTDAAGITTNLSVMQDRYAKSIGTTAAKLTESQKIQAAYNGMLDEGAIFAGNADDAMTGYTGTQATFQSTLANVRTELGEAYIPYLERVLELITPLLGRTAEWTSENQEVAAGLTAAAIAVAGLIAVLATLSAALLAINTLMGPIGWTIVAIGTLVAGVGAYTAVTNQASESVKEFTANQEQLNKALSDTSNSLNANQYEMLQSNMETLSEVLARRNELEKEYNELTSAAERGEGSIENTHKMFELADAIKAVDKELKALDFSSVEEAEFALRNMKKASDESLGALVQLTRQQMQENIALVDNISEMKAMSEEYDELNKQANLTEQQKARLETIVKKLKAEYPDLIVLLDEENQWHIENKNALDDYITGEENRLNAAIATAKQVIEAAKIEAEERVRLARESMAEIERIEAKGLTSSKTSMPFLSDATAGIFDRNNEWVLNQTKKQLVNDINKGNYSVNEANKLLDDLTIGYDPFRRKTNPEVPEDNKKKGKKEKKKKEKEKKQKTAAELAEEEYQKSLAYIQYKKDLNQLSEKQELAMLEKLENRYKQYSDIRKDAEVRIYKLKDEMYKKEYNDEKKLMNYKQDLGQLSEKEELARLEKMLRKYKDNTELRMQLEVEIYQLKEQMKEQDFQHSKEWIAKEEKRMILAGATEEAIAKMKMSAWTRVRNRYAKDMDFYKEADEQITNLKINQLKEVAKQEAEAAKEKEKQRKDDLKRTLDAINKAKKSELDALNERRKAIQKFYEEQNENIDDSERLKERNELLAEMEKYRFATSEKGQKHFQELQEKLRKMDIDQQKRDLQEERDQKLEAIDDEKKDIEAWYDELREATDELTGDLTKLYKLADDERLKSFIDTNEKIKEEMEKLKTIMTGVSAQDTKVVAQMIANSAAWASANPAERARLSEENDRLGASIGAVKNEMQGRWYKPDGTPLYHSGGIAGEMNFRSADQLMPDEITAILKRGEPVLTPQQIGSLVSASAGNGGASIHIEKFMEVNEPVFEDGIDLRSFGRDTGNEAAEILRKQLTGGA